MSKIVLTLICISILLGMTACSTKNVEDEDGQYFVSQTGYAGNTEKFQRMVNDIYFMRLINWQV